jgi:hypothetical protein
MQLWDCRGKQLAKDEEDEGQENGKDAKKKVFSRDNFCCHSFSLQIILFVAQGKGAKKRGRDTENLSSNTQVLSFDLAAVPIIVPIIILILRLSNSPRKRPSFSALRTTIANFAIPGKVGATVFN